MTRAYGRPLLGPIETEPRGVDLVEAAAMLDTAVHGLVLGAYDRRIVAWLGSWDQPTIATVASLLARARTHPALADAEGER